MPFVTKEHRQNPHPAISGDRCYEEYKDMMSMWRGSPRWTTVDKIASLIWPDQWQRAAILAFLVFFCLHVMPYERKKRRENGDV